VGDLRNGSADGEREKEMINLRAESRSAPELLSIRPVLHETVIGPQSAGFHL